MINIKQELHCIFGLNAKMIWKKQRLSFRNNITSKQNIRFWMCSVKLQASKAEKFVKSLRPTISFDAGKFPKTLYKQADHSELAKRGDNWAETSPLTRLSYIIESGSNVWEIKQKYVWKAKKCAAILVHITWMCVSPFSSYETEQRGWYSSQYNFHATV